MSDSVNISGGPWSARIETRGAQLRSLCLEDAELLWPGDPDGWKDTAPVLFPVVGRLWGDALWHEGQSHPHPMHGIVRAAAFDVLEVEADRVKLCLDHASSEAFPWEFRLEITFAIHTDGLHMNACVCNPSEVRNLPFQFGWHPGFAGGDFRIGWDAAQPLTIHEVVPGEGWRTGSIVEIGEALTSLAWSEQPTAWVTSLETTSLWLAGTRAPLRVSAEPAPVAWVLWQRPGQGFLCLEPWYGLPDRVGGTCDFSSREATRTLSPQARWQVAFRIGKGNG